MDRIRRSELKRRISFRIRELNSRCGVSGRALARGTGIPYDTIIKAVRGTILPSIESVIAIADYYAVPLDYLLARCDEETANHILNNFPECFMELRRASYEDYLEARKNVFSPQADGKPGKRDIPFPYNLLALIDPKTDFGKITEDHLERLWLAWDRQKPQYAKFLEDYYARGCTLNDIAQKNGVSKQSVQFTIKRAINALRFLYGIEDEGEKVMVGRNGKKVFSDNSGGRE